MQEIPESKNNESVSPTISSSPSAPEKKRKKYEWTEKRMEAFQKMRKGLEEKTLITKQIKEQKKKEEKDAIKQKVKEIMSGKASLSSSKKAKQESESESEPSSESEEEERKSKKEKKKTKELAKKKSKKRKEVSSSESEQESESESSDDESVHGRQVMSERQKEHYRREKVNTGKVSKQTPYVNGLDRFILL